MVKLLGKKVSAGGMDYLDLLAAGLAKYATERALSPIIGNGTIKSGGIKLVGGMGLKAVAGTGPIQNPISLALAIDGMEDILTAVIGGSGIGGGTGDSW